jgi:hypothetical protein
MIRMTDYLPHDSSRPHLALRRDQLWVPESRLWGLSCEFVGAAMRPR